jgi:hypothetical protein
MNEETDPNFKLTEEDVRQAKLVQQMRMHAGFPVLVEFWNVQREAIISAGKTAAKSKDAAIASGYWMELAGFDKACAIIEKVAARAENATEIEKLEKEGKDLAQQ